MAAKSAGANRLWARWARRPAGICAPDFSPAAVAASDVNAARLQALAAELGIQAADNPAAVAGARRCWAVKPQIFPAVLMICGT